MSSSGMASAGPKVNGEWLLNASIFQCHDAFFGRLVFTECGEVVYLASGGDLVGRGVGRWAADGPVFGFQVAIFQYVASSTKHVQNEPHRFLGIARLPPAKGTWTGEWWFTPWQQPSRSVGKFQCRRRAGGPLPSSSEAGAVGELPRVPRAAVVAALELLQEAPPMLEKRWLPHRLSGGVPDVHYVRNFFEPRQVEDLERMIERHADWQHMATRDTEEFGCGERCPCGRSMARAELPKWQDNIILALHNLGAFHPVLYPANNVRLNAYERGQGIHPHMDGPVYYPRAAIISLGSPCVFDFYSREDDDEVNRIYAWDSQYEVPAAPPLPRGAVPRVSVVLEPGSLLVFSGDAFVVHRHGIRATAEDEISAATCNASDLGLKVGDKLRRGRGVSLTVRHLLPRCQCSNVV